MGSASTQNAVKYCAFLDELLIKKKTNKSNVIKEEKNSTSLKSSAKIKDTNNKSTPK